jgi:hypothetical protein
MIDYKRELIEFIEYVLENELPYEASWIYATELKKRLESIGVDEE